MIEAKIGDHPTFGGKLLRDLSIRERRSTGCRHRAGQPASPSERSPLEPTPRMSAALTSAALISAALTSALLILVVSTSVFALTLLVAARPAFAGPNEGGMLLLHCNETLQFSAGSNFDGYAQLYDAKDAVTQVPGDGQGVIYFVLASFDEFAMPKLKSISFGIELSSPTVEPIRWGVTGETNIVAPIGSWPSSGSGIGIGWSAPFTRRLEEIYWFCGYAYAGQTVKLVEDPVHGGEMVDDAFPPILDTIAGYGMLGFGVKGFNPRSDGEATGACCSGSGRCLLRTSTGCQALSGYNYTGDNTVCSPNPCTPGVGACCIRADCRMLLWDECLDARGLFQSEGVGCEPTPCEFTRVETTWGALKSTYRR
jgi:hypothetical protein